MLTNLYPAADKHHEGTAQPLPMSAVYNHAEFISHFVSLHHHSTQPTLTHQLLTTEFPNTFSEFWILYDDNLHQPLACVGANTVMSNASVGYVGLFEARTVEAGIAVLKAATAWLQRGRLGQFEPVHQILGPVNLTTWLQYRLRVDTDPQPSMSYEPRHPVFYQSCFEQAGFKKAVDYYSTFFDIDQAIRGFEAYSRGETLADIGLKSQPWNTLNLWASLTPERHPDLTPQDNVAKRVYDLSIELFQGKDLFDNSFSRQNHRQIVLNDMISRPEVDNQSLLDLSTFVVDTRTGKDVGYVACWVENQDTIVIKTVGFLPQVRKTRAFCITMLEAFRRAKDVWGATRCSCALMNENSTGISERVAGKSVRHVYRLYIHQQPPSQLELHHQALKNANSRASGLERQPSASTISPTQVSSSPSTHRSAATSTQQSLGQPRVPVRHYASQGYGHGPNRPIMARL